MEQRHNPNASWLRVYPNPANDRVHIITATEGLSRLRVIHSSGQILLEDESYISGKAIDVSKFAAGIYLVEIIQGRERYTTKLSKD